MRIKICGLTRPEDIAAAERFGADAIGLNFHPASPRYLDPKTVAPLLRSISPLLACVGVWVTQPLRQVCAVAYQLGLRGVQWYGGASDLSDPFPFAMVSGFRVKSTEQLQEIDRYLLQCEAAGWLPGSVLVDAFVEGQMGGTGQKAPWDLLANWKPKVPLILAGGLTPDNVAEAIRTVRPAGVDVASGVESAPGIKDHGKLRAFIENARFANSE
jgi:phosphoribosylanthranilate isomerase